jgi:hypothetical protein
LTLKNYSWAPIYRLQLSTEKCISVSIGQTSATLATVSASSPSTIAQTQNSPSTDTSAATGTPTAVDPSAGLPASAWNWLGLHMKLGSDAQTVGTALVSSMQSLIFQRPDLANAQFDFQSADDGSIKVTSSTLSDSDKTWLQGLLNSNSGLVQAVKSFRDDAVASYSAAAEATGMTASQDQMDAVSAKADSIGFMQLFKQMGADASQTLDSSSTYFAPNGAKIDPSQDPGSAVGLLNFMQGAQSLNAGTAKAVDNGTGRIVYGTKMSVFENSDALPSFLPTDSTSLGMHVTG